jgi:hypothetical protein
VSQAIGRVSNGGIVTVQPNSSARIARPSTSSVAKHRIREADEYYCEESPLIVSMPPIAFS